MRSSLLAPQVFEDGTKASPHPARAVTSSNRTPSGRPGLAASRSLCNLGWGQSPKCSDLVRKVSSSNPRRLGTNRKGQG